MFGQRAGIRSIVLRSKQKCDKRLGIYTEDAESAEDTEKKE
jgi:hypothetical protein